MLSAGLKTQKNRFRPRLRPDLTGLVYTASQTSWLVGRGLATPSPVSKTSPRKDRTESVINKAKRYGYLPSDLYIDLLLLKVWNQNFSTVFGTIRTMFCISYYLLKRTFTIKISFTYSSRRRQQFDQEEFSA